MWESFRMGSCPVGLKDRTPRRESARFSSSYDDMDMGFSATLPRQPIRRKLGNDPGRRKRMRPFGTNLVKATLVLITCYFLIEPLAQAQTKEVRRVLVFYEIGLASPAATVLDREISATLESSQYQIEFYREHLETTLFPDQATQKEFQAWYIHKYRNLKPDLIIAAGPSSISFLLDFHERDFRDVPVIFCGATEETADKTKLNSHFTGVWENFEPAKTIETSLKLLPKTKHLVVVGGTSSFDRNLEALVRERLHDFEGRLDLTYLTELDMPTLLERLKHLPEHTIILYTHIAQDAAGTHFVGASQADPMIVGAANAPIFSLTDVDVGHGEAGGDITSFATEGQIAGGMALRVLNGEKPQDIPVVRGANAYMFDWRALHRWGMNEAGLPPGSIVLNQPSSLWQAYRRYFLAGILLLLAQAMIVLGLLWQKVKRKRVEAALVRSSDRLRLAMESGNSVGWEWDLATGRDFWFGDLRTMFGISSDKFDGQIGDFYRYVHPEDQKRVSETVADAMRNRKPYAQEYRVVRQDGVVRWVVSRGQFEYAENGDARRMVGLAVDITERKQTEDALMKSEEKFSKAFWQSPLAISLTSVKDHRYLEINDTYLRIAGRTRAELVGRTPFDIGLWANPDERTRFINRLLAEGSIRNLEVSFRKKNGELGTGLASAELIEINGELCALSVAADITEVKRAEEARQVSERRFGQFFETLPEYCYMISPTGEILDANPAACKALGYTREELIGKSISAIYAPESATKSGGMIERWKKTGTLHNEEMVILTKGGEKRTVLINAGSVKDAQGNLLHSASVQVDITERKEIQEKLRASESRLEGIVTSAMDAILAVDQDQRIVVFNAAAEKMFGCPAQEAIGTSVDRFIPQRFRTAHGEHIHHFGETGITTRNLSAPGELWAIRANGEEFPIEASISRAEAGGKKLFTVIIRDVTERRRVEEALKRSERRSREQVLYSPVAMVVTREGTSEIEVLNFKFTQLFGYSIDDVPDEAHWWSLAYPDEAYREAIKAEWQRRVEKAIKSDIEIEPMEATVRCKDGSMRHIEFHFASLGDAGLVSFVDLTEREQAALALRESEQRFRLVANTAPVMIWTSGLDRLCDYFNKTWLDFTGRPLEAELGNGWTEGVHSEDLVRCLDVYTKAFEQREAFEMEYRLRRHDGEYRWILDLGVPRFNENGSFAGYIGSCLDVTERRAAEEALSNVSRRLIEAHEEERTWIARELHDDINQRLALLAVNMAFLEQDIPESAVGLRNGLQEKIKGLAEIASEIQALSHRLHSSKLEYLGLAAAAASFCSELSDRQKVEIDFHSEDIPKKLPQEISLCLFRVLQEALQNAAKHSSSQRFQVMLSSTPNEIHLTVRDSGIGFDLEEALQGRGLGLISMKERLKLVDGKLSIDSQPRGGTKIRATVPVSLGPKSARAASQ